MNYIARISIILIATLFASVATAKTDNAIQSKVFIEGMMTKSLNIVNNETFDTDYKRDKLREMVDAYFNFELIGELTLSKFSSTSKKALGRYSKHRFTPQQQTEFTRLFQTHLTNLYLDRLSDTTRLEAAVTGSTSLKPKKNLQRARVTSIINNITAIDYSLSMQEERWSIYDVRVEGRSLVTSFRKEYNSLLIKNSPDELLQLLREKNAAHN